MTGQAAWAIRTIPRDRIVDDLLVLHYSLTFAGISEAEARPDIEAALDRWLGLGLGCSRGPGGEQLFDPVEVLNFLIAAGRYGHDDFWERHYVASGRRQVEALQGLTEGGSAVPGPAQLRPRRFRVRLERDYDLSGLADGARVRLRLPLPIEDNALRELRLEIEAPAGATIRQEAARLDASLTLASPGLVTLAATADFEACGDAGLAAPLSDEDRVLYTRPREELICVSDRVRAQAEAIAAGVLDDSARADALFSAFFDRFLMGCVPYHAVDPERPSDWPFASGVADCQIGSALFCAMCRALGIPARICSGYQLYSPNMSYHYWAEAWTEERGWRSYDLAAWHLSMAGRDRLWARVFAGWLDHRMKVQQLPKLFTGPSTRRFPLAWHMVRRRLGGGIETSFLDARSGCLIYRDRVTLLPASTE